MTGFDGFFFQAEDGIRDFCLSRGLGDVYKRQTISIKLNEQGFHDIFNKYYVTLCLFANQYTENQETSADIVQDSFAKLWQIREDFFYLHQVKAFLYTAVRNKALNELEHSKVVYEYAQNVIEKKKDSFFHDAIVEEETYRIVSEAINKLPDQMKAIMQLSLEGKKNAEIADRLNISTETVHTLKKIAYKKLRENLKDYLSLIHISEPTRQAEISYAVFCLKKKKNKTMSHIHISETTIASNTAPTVYAQILI